MNKRTHLVLVPGFGGFDALGQIFYYAGVSFSADRWRLKNPSRTLALHYFESLPTAGVRTRAMALRAFLEERELRGIFQRDDRITLLGHSTGGLDIRQLLVNLGFGDFDVSYRDDVEKKMVEDKDLRERIDRLVFLSVPQRGTNIADFIRHFRTVFRLGLEQGELIIKAQHETVFERIDRWLLSKIDSRDLRPQLLAALRDTVADMLPPASTKTPSDRYQAALARAAHGELIGWLDNVETDFFAIDDLAVNPAPDAPRTPSRYSETDRRRELEAWKAAHVPIRTRSYATVGRRPYDKDPAASSILLAEIGHVVSAVVADQGSGTDVVYRAAYAATAAGPFEIVGDASVTDNGVRRVLRSWENDGIVNTASMLWPDGPETRLVHADHGDIIGHYRPTDPIKGSEQVTTRKNHSYDILGSNSGFRDEVQDFDRVWHEIFDFATDE
ncbi:MAG TPA: hypothetical protein VFG30_25790 [Polyangiales bacterium]|nr:hypothetical protein [Polyangiales bacterium]